MGNIRGGTLGFHGTIGQPTAQVIDGSLKFDKTAQTYLTRTPGSAGNRKVWTLSYWIKFYGDIGAHLFSANNDAFQLELRSGGQLLFANSGSTSSNTLSTAQFRDYGQFYHVVIQHDATKTIARFYINGEQNFTATLSNADGTWNNATSHNINGRSTSIDSFGSFGMSQVYFIDGLSLGPGYFGFTDPLTGTWRPKKFRAEGTTVNDGTTWSTTCTFSRATSGFDGNFNTSNAAYLSSAGTGTITTAPFTIKNSLRIYNNARSDQGGRYTVTINGIPVSFDGSGTSSTAYRWTEIDLSGFSLPLKVTNLQYTVPGSSGTGFDAVEVDGVLMLDSTTTNLSFGTNGFYLPMDNEDDFEIDKSGKGNNWTKTNFSGTSINPDVLKDSPSGAVFGGRGQTGITTTSSAPSNYCTWNPLNKGSSITTSDGNLKAQLGSTGHVMITGNMAMPKGNGKYYWEIVTAGWNTSNQGPMAGIVGDTHDIADQANGSPSILFRAAGEFNVNGSTISTGHSTFTTNDVIGVALDLDRNIITWYKNGSQLFQYTSVSSSVNSWLPAWKDSDSGGNAVANWGQKPFKYAPPQGFLPLNTASITPVKVIPRPDQYVGITTYTGTNASVQKIKTEFEADFVWLKSRSGDYNNALFDTVRGATKKLVTNSTGAESTDSEGVKTFFDNGVTVGNSNEFGADPRSYIMWHWKAGGSKNTFNVDDVGYATFAASGTTAGTITPTGTSIGTKQGFSIIKYAGTDTGSSQTIPHGLNEPPVFWMFKNLSQAGDWIVYTTAIDGGSDYLKLNATDAANSGVSPWSTAPTNSVITVGTNNVDTCNDGDNYVMYAWHNVTGLQKFGKYVANGGNTGPVINCGFRPKIVWVKRSSSSDDYTSWSMFDTERDPFNAQNRVSGALYANKSAPEDRRGNASTEEGYESINIHFLSNGFQLMYNGGEINGPDGTTYIYAAWAEAPASNLFGGQSNAR